MPGEPDASEASSPTLCFKDHVMRWKESEEAQKVERKERKRKGERVSGGDREEVADPGRTGLIETVSSVKRDRLRENRGRLSEGEKGRGWGGVGDAEKARQRQLWSRALYATEESFVAVSAGQRLILSQCILRILQVSASPTQGRMANMKMAVMISRENGIIPVHGCGEDFIKRMRLVSGVTAGFSRHQPSLRTGGGQTKRPGWLVQCFIGCTVVSSAPTKIMSLTGLVFALTSYRI